MSNPIQTLRQRGLLQDHTDEESLVEHLTTDRRTFYVGFDPTAPSLHVGNLAGLMVMAWLQRAGHRPIALAGGATGRIGDPSFRDEERHLMSDEEVERNLEGIRRDFGRVLDMSSAVLVDNYEWTKDVTVLDFLRDIGKHFSVNQLISREAIRRRMEEREQGISYTEFSYTLLQAMDYDHLYRTYGCTLQGGGSDQWGNILSGVDLIRRRHGAQVHAITWPLVEGSDGKKFSNRRGMPLARPADLTVRVTSGGSTPTIAMSSGSCGCTRSSRSRRSTRWRKPTPTTRVPASVSASWPPRRPESCMGTKGSERPSRRRRFCSGTLRSPK